MASRAGRAPGVTIGDVAAAAQVSRATVSRAFTRPQLLSQETVERVRTVAARLGYVGNQAARALSTGRFGNIAVVVPDIANPFFPPLVRSLQLAAETADLAVFLGDSDESAEREAKLIARLAAQVEGFVLASPRLSEALIRELAATRPVVLVNRDLDGIPRVLIDSSGGMTEAVLLLKKLGHQRLVYLAGPRDSWSDQQRRETLTQTSAKAGLTVEIVEVGRPTYAAGRDSVSAVVRSGATAAIAFDDVVSQGVLAGLEVRGISVPTDFSLVGCDDTLAALTTPALTSVSAGAATAGTAAAKLLVNLLEATEPHTEPSTECVTIATHLVTRATTAAAPKSTP
ncbi:LacI family DNA-binding transcriptional regulator [Kribbella speibonae]|uniref:LacI family transcriptional regulator n=1 Tax=Kribbella speibonae TaxID=1572660 RepID=A0ABY2AD83_9ACTN|nr:LacI family DNA-binding transcriptional regulator [Kribbella speibonae]TCC27043.1 LacI family transcriptional regulator [Kribbella speibonae]